MAWKIICKQCGEKFVVSMPSDRSRQFCCLPCCWKWRRENKKKVSGVFRKGSVPWNSGTKGVMKSNSGSFKPGYDSEKRLPLGSVTLRVDKSKKRRAWVKITDNGDSYDWRLRAIVEWEKVHGDLLDGQIIHHKDGDTLNDKVSNLMSVTRSEHLTIHRLGWEEKRKYAASKANKKRHAVARVTREQSA